MKASLGIAIPLVAAMVAGCAGLGSEAEWGSLTGHAIYPRANRIPPGSVLRARLLDVSRQDARAELIAETMIPLEGREPPVTFSLAYRREAVRSSHHYAVRATIDAGERTVYATTESYPVLTRDAPGELEVHLQIVGAPP